MSDFTISQGVIITYYILVGLGFAVLFDIFTVTQKLFHNPKWLIIVEDILFWIIFTIVYFLMNYNLLNGEIKGYTLIGTVLGAAVYYAATRLLFKKKT